MLRCVCITATLLAEPGTCCACCVQLDVGPSLTPTPGGHMLPIGAAVARLAVPSSASQTVPAADISSRSCASTVACCWSWISCCSSSSPKPMPGLLVLWLLLLAPHQVNTGSSSTAAASGPLAAASPAVGADFDPGDRPAAASRTAAPARTQRGGSGAATSACCAPCCASSAAASIHSAPATVAAVHAEGRTKGCHCQL